MHCKDCFYYKMCIPNVELIKMQIDENTMEKHCVDFKDKSKVIELPCKVGDIVYVIDEYDLEVNRCIIENFLICAGKTLYFRANYYVQKGEELEELVDEYDLEESDIGKTVFFTKEQAEQALRKEDEGK